jgi:hypothetical protein
MVTDLAVDPNNPEALVVTLGQWGNEDYVYVAPNAKTTPSNQWTENFRSIQSDLPKIPVYSACVNANPNTSQQLMLGTEWGVFVTDNYLTGTPQWEQANKIAKINSSDPERHLGSVPVFSIRQNRMDYRRAGRHEMGTIIIATYGRGIFVNKSNIYTKKVVNIDEKYGENTGSIEIIVYPNPTSDIANVRITTNETAAMQIRIYDLSGKIVYSEQTAKLEKGTHNITVPVDKLGTGTYILQCQNGKTQKSVKIVKN